MLDVNQYLLGCDEITKYIHRNQKTPETLVAQQRVLKRWNLHRESLIANTKLDHEAMSEIQLRTISMMVDFSFSNHPFYNKIYKDAGFKRGDIISWDDYQALPVIDKSSLIDNYDLFRKVISPRPDECDSVRSSGSSGRAVEVIIDPVVNEVGTVLEMRFYEQMLGRKREPNDWLYMIYLAAPAFSSLNGEYPIFTLSNDCPPEIAINHIKRLKPKILTGFASYFNRMSKFIGDPNELGIEAISTNSEPSTQAERDAISKVFGAPVFDEYSSVELGYIATQCKAGSYHLVEDNVRIDLINKDEQGRGELVGTDLVNTYFPLIKYKQGDIVSIKDHGQDCPCGCKFRELHSFGGRSDHHLYSSVVGKVPSDLVMSLYDRLLVPTSAGIDEFRIVQVESDLVELLIKPIDSTRGFDQASVADFSRGLKVLFECEALNIKVHEVEVMPPTKSHKRCLIENQYSASQKTYALGDN